MLESLALKNYRAFASLEIGPLARVNLLVGKNNSGKSSVLESIEILGASGRPELLHRLAQERGELVAVERDASVPYTFLPDISHFFHGHDVEFGARLNVSSGGGVLGDITLSVQQGSIEQRELDFFRGYEARAGYTPDFGSGMVLRITSSGEEGATEAEIPLHAGRALVMDRMRHTERFLRQTKGLVNSRPIVSVSVNSTPARQLAAAWDLIVAEGLEQEVVQTLKLLEPRINNVFFMGERFPRAGSGGILIAVDGQRKRTPLGSYGEGMRRLLSLSVALIMARDGVLLVDEIDTGLHYSVMDKMWNFLLQGAARNNVQVFATTHSKDCLIGLARCMLSSSHASPGVARIFRIEPEVIAAKAVEAEDLDLILQQDIEIR